MSDRILESQTSADYRSALSIILAQFIRGEELACDVIPLLMEHFDDEPTLAKLEKQLDDEKRHHGMLANQIKRLDLPLLPASNACEQYIDRVTEIAKRKDVVGAFMAGSYLLEGIAFSTLMMYSDVVEPDLGKVLADIMSDEGRHISLNISLVRRMVDEDPGSVGSLLDVHKEFLPGLFEVYVTAFDLNDSLGLELDYIGMKILSHFHQRIRRLHLPPDAARRMFNDYLKAAASVNAPVHAPLGVQ